MKVVLFAMVSMMLMCSGCITRTTSEAYGADGRVHKDSGGTVIKKETIWFWQKDFRKPQ